MIGDRIQAALDMRGMSQRQLAQATSMEQATINRYVKGKRTAKPSTLAKIARVLGVTVSYLMELSDDPTGDDNTVLPEHHIPTPIIPVCKAPKELLHPDSVSRHFIAPPSVFATHPHALYVEVPDDRINRKVPRGYIAMVDVGIEHPKAGAIHCVAVDDALVFGVLSELSNGFELAPLSYDPTARPIVVDYSVSHVDKLGVVIRATMPDWYEL